MKFGDDRDSVERVAPPIAPPPLLYGVPPEALVEAIQVVRNDDAITRAYESPMGREARTRILRRALMDVAQGHEIPLNDLVEALKQALPRD